MLPIVSGTGGKSFATFGTQRSVIRQNTDHGAVRLSLLPTSYTGEFINIDGEVMDTFSGSCKP